MKKHTEIIKCPGCGLIQPAVVRHTFPCHSHEHNCVKCKYIITESEWEIAEFPKKEKRKEFLEKSNKKAREETQHG